MAMSPYSGFLPHGGDVTTARAQFPDAPEPFIDLSTGINPNPYPLPDLPSQLFAQLPQRSALERLMDRCQKDLEPLRSFTLPGGGRLNAFLHQARTVCRRAEREVLALSRVEPINAWALRYVNRLSDAFFVLGRWVGKRMGEKEYLWERGLASHARAKRKRS